MEEKMKCRKGITLLAVALVSSLLLFAACKPHHPKGAFMFDYLTEVLDLSEAQQASLMSIKEDLLTEVEDMRDDKQKMIPLLKAQLAEENMDKEALQDAIRQHRQKMDILIESAVDKLVTFHAELTPVQREKLIAKLEKFEKNKSCKFPR